MQKNQTYQDNMCIYNHKNKIVSFPILIAANGYHQQMLDIFYFHKYRNIYDRINSSTVLFIYTAIFDKITRWLSLEGLTF